MIVKSVSHKHNNFARLINYIYNDHGRSNPEITFDLCHNLRSIDKEEIISEFKENAQLKKKRKNGTSLYHDILSFSPKDRKHLTLDKLYDLSLKYIELRGAAGICFAKPHVHQDHLHVHFCFSGNQYQSEKALRMTMREFYQVREDLEKYQIKEYSELAHSLVYIKKSRNIDIHEAEPLLNQVHESSTLIEVKTPKSVNYVGDKNLRLAELTTQIQHIFDQSKGLEDFFQRLKDRGFQPFERNGKLYGVLLNERKISFEEIQISKTHIDTLKRFDEFTQLRIREKRENRMR